MPNMLKLYSKLGYCVRGIQINYEDFLLPIWWTSFYQQQWLFEAKKKSKFWTSHITDYFRFFILHKFGGVYSDVDSLFLQSIP